MRRRLAIYAFTLAVISLTLVGVAALWLDSAALPNSPPAAISVIYDRYGTPLARLLPNNAGPVGANSAGTNPVGAGPAGTSPTAGSFVSLEAMSPVFVAAATVATQSISQKSTAPDLLSRLWEAISADPSADPASAPSADPASDLGPEQNLAELYVQPPSSEPPALKQRLTTALLAGRVERDFSDPELLEQYLNVARFGRGAYGASRAAATWFGTSLADLSVSQAAFLAAWIAPESGLPTGEKMPADFIGPAASSVADVARATQARNAVLFTLFQGGDITADELESARSETLDDLLAPYSPASRVELLVPDAGLAEAVAAVQEQLLTRYGEKTLSQGGLHVITTLDLSYQRSAVTTAAALASSSPARQASLVVLDDTGGVRAAVGALQAPQGTAPANVSLIPAAISSVRPPAETDQPAELPAPSDQPAAPVTALEVAARYSILARAGELRYPYWVTSVQLGPVIANAANRAPQLPTAAGIARFDRSIDRHEIERASVLSSAAAAQLTDELMQPLANEPGLPDLPALVRAVPPVVGSSSLWLVGWSEQLVVAIHAQFDPAAADPAAAGTDDPATALPDGPATQLTAAFSDLMRGWHFWPQP